MIRTALRQLSRRRFISSTATLLEKQVVPVPAMGDAITEGTIVEWTVEVGQAVKADDVIALVETDKVTVDIKAQVDGVITQRFGEVDDTVEVGKDLYEIDTEGQATVSQPTPGSSKNDSKDLSTAKEQAPESSASEQKKDASASVSPTHRSPSIHFLGKDGWAALKSGKKTSQPEPPLPTKPNGVFLMDGSMISSDYGRPKFTEEEMEALILGGASIAPQLIKKSKGAVFK